MGSGIAEAVTQPINGAAVDQRRTHELAALYAVATAINQALTEQEALSQALKQVLPVLKLASGRIYLWDAAAKRLVLAAAEGEPLTADLGNAPELADICACDLVAVKGDPFTALDAERAAEVVQHGCRRYRGYACAAVPLLAKKRALGVLHVANRQGAPFSEGDMALLRFVAAQMGVALENMRLREEARQAEALTTLIQEMHHRIKNNLQTVADLLSLEMSASPSPAARKSLRDSITRIKSIGAVHQLLSAENIRLTDITELARQVCDISLRHLVRPDQHVEAVIEGPSIYLPSKQATALALVMNELISNALEHAFSFVGQQGRLEIRLAQEGPRVTVTVSDNGRGLPPDFDINHARGLGLQIVHTLVEKDLAGTLRFEPGENGGSRVTLTFYK
ncbi:MAG: sensor histidine kinase [Anaerolineae bacterium]